MVRAVVRNPPASMIRNTKRVAAARKDLLKPVTVSSHRVSLFQGRKGLRLGHNDLIVVEAAPERHERGEDRQNGDHTQTHYLPPSYSYAYQTLSPLLEPHFAAYLVTKLPQCWAPFSL
jgi:hypothetical protein